MPARVTPRSPGGASPLRPPSRLGSEERRAWRDLVAELGDGAEAASPAGLEAAACQLARMRWARGRIEADGEIVLDARDRPVAHPAIAIEQRAQAELRRWMETLAPARRRAGRPVGATSAPDRPSTAAGEPPRIRRVK